MALWRPYPAAVTVFLDEDSITLAGYIASHHGPLSACELCFAGGPIVTRFYMLSAFYSTDPLFNPGHSMKKCSIGPGSVSIYKTN